MIIALLNGELIVKRLACREGRVFLESEHPEYPSITINAEQDLDVWGVVTNVIHSLR